jgi:thiol:disulfide interchange protein
MSALLAQFSFLIAVIIIGAGLAALLWRWKNARPALRAGVFAWFVFLVLVIALLFRYPATPNLHTPAEVEAVLANGQPAFIMLYSNYCMGCMANLPRVQDMLPALANAGINTLLLDVNTSPAREMLSRFNFVSTPTFLLYAADGTELYRSHGAPALTEIFAVVQ